MIRKNRCLPGVVLLALFGLAGYSPAVGAPVVYSGTGTTNTNSAINAFRSAMGGINNGGATGEQPGGRREINWDAVTLNGADPGSTVISAGKTVQISNTRFQSRGVLFTGSSAVSGDGFNSVNPGATGNFVAFSPVNIFAPFNSNQITVNFVVAGTGTGAAVRGFGAVFLDVEQAGTSSIEYFNYNTSIGKYFVPVGTNAQPEFLGVLFDAPSVTSVKITVGTGQIFSFNGTTITAGTLESNDLAALDDFIYSEPTAAISSWMAVDVAAGPDNTSRLLWRNVNGTIAVWTLDSSGAFVTGRNYGPFAPFTARAVAVAGDNTTRLLWVNNITGEMVIWTLDSTGMFQKGFNIGATGGFLALDIAAGPDNTSRILSNNSDNSASKILTVSATGAVQNETILMAPANATGTAIGVGADGNSRVLFSSSASISQAVILVVQPDGTQVTTITLGPYLDNYSAIDMAVGADNRIRLLWESAFDNSLAVWTLNSANTGPDTTASMNYGGTPQFNGWYGLALDVARDGTTRLLWDNFSGAAAIYTLNPNQTLRSGYNYGPYP